MTTLQNITSQVQQRSRDVGGSPECPCLVRGDCCPPGKGCNRAGPSSREEAGVLHPLLHRTQERWWPSTNPGSASFEPGFTQVQDADAHAHYQMHPAPGLVCSDRPLPVSSCVHEGRRRRLTPLREVGVRILNYLDDWLILAQSREQLGDHRDLVLRHLSQLGLRGQLGKEQSLPCADNLFSQCGVRLGEYDGTPHGGTCPSSVELPDFLQRQECGTTETVSEAPGAYGIRSCSHAARIASLETTSALATLPGPEVGMALWYTASGYHPAVSPLPQPLDGPCLSTGRSTPRTSVLAYCCHNRCLQHGLGHYMQWAGSGQGPDCFGTSTA